MITIYMFVLFFYLKTLEIFQYDLHLHPALLQKGVQTYFVVDFV